MQLALLIVLPFLLFLPSITPSAAITLKPQSEHLIAVAPTMHYTRHGIVTITANGATRFVRYRDVVALDRRRSV